MRPDEPSGTARGVALMRSLLDRTPWPSGDAAADDRLTATLVEHPPDEDARRTIRATGIFRWVEARTAFFDAALTTALTDGIAQVVTLGAGYDGRAVRFRTPGVTFFEVDHPATQADKRERYASSDAPLDGVVFVAADFTEPGLGDALASAGHSADRPTILLCEGVLRYLPEAALRDLLRTAAERAAAGSVLCTTFSTRDGAPSDEDLVREQALAAAGEAVLTVPPEAVALDWVEAAGWEVMEIDGVRAGGETAAANGRLLIRAVPSSGRPPVGG